MVIQQLNNKTWETKQSIIGHKQASNPFLPFISFLLHG